MTTSAFKPLSLAEESFKTIIWDPLITTGEVALAGVESTIPVLDLGIFQDLEDDAIKAITDAIYNQLVEFIDVEAIQLVNPILQAKWSSASESLSIIADEKGATSDAYKQALAAAATDFSAWVHTG